MSKLDFKKYGLVALYIFVAAGIAMPLFFRNDTSTLASWFCFGMLVSILIAMFVRYWKNRTVYYFVTFMSASHRRGWLFMSYRAVFDVKDAERMISEKTNHSVLILSYKRISKSEYKANIHAYEKGSEK